MSLQASNSSPGEQAAPRKARKGKAEFKREHGIFLELLASGKAPLEVRHIMNLSKVQFERHLLDALASKELHDIPCRYAAEAASGFPESVRKLLAASPESLVKCEIHEAGDGRQCLLSILPVGVTAPNGMNATGSTAQ